MGSMTQFLVWAIFAWRPCSSEKTIYGRIRACWIGWLPLLYLINRLLRNRFIGYSTGVDSKEPHICISDDAYNIVSSHDFKADRNTLTQLNTYPEVKEKLNRRIQRFLEKTATCKRILFVRTEGTLQQAQELQTVLSGMVTHDFRILLINHTDVNGIVEKNWSLEKVCALELPNKEIWEGNDHHWRTILSGIQLV
jgi:hypothetical protein